MKALRKKARKENLVPSKGKENIVAFEAQTDLICHVQFTAEGREFGAYLLGKGEDRYRLVFGFDCDGIHPNLPDAQIESIYAAISNGFKELPENELLTIHMRSFVDDRDRTQELAQSVSRAKNPVLKYVAASELKRVETLSQKGLRKAKTLRMFATFTYDPDSDVKDNRIEKIAKGLCVALGNFSGAEQIRKDQQFFAFLEAGFNAFLLWEQIFINKMGLGVRALTVEELWADLWHRFNDAPTIPVPQMLIFDRHSIREEINSRIHATSLLLKTEDAVPVADYRWLRLKRKYVAILSLLDQPDEWQDEREAINFYWNKLGRDLVYDVEIVTQLSKLSQTEERQRLTDITKEKIFKAEKASEEGDINVGAGIDLKEALEARALLHQGEVSLSSATVFLVHRDTLDNLEQACNYLESLFLYPANLHRETNYVWTTWIQTLPCYWGRLMRYQLFDRTNKVFSNYVLGAVPLARIQPIDRTGVEYLSEDGGVPIHIDMVNRHHNAIFLGTTRSGKGVNVIKYANDFLINDIPVSIIDFPQTDIATFKDYTNLVDGAYFDVGSEAVNIFELPDLNSFSKEVRKQRHRDYQDFLLEVLLGMVAGAAEPNPRINADLIRSILALIVDKFFNDYEIKANIRLARTGGFGSPEWEKYPTLRDFLGFCSPERIGIGESIEQIKALDFIHTKLRAWLASKIGCALSRPSTFRADSKLFVMAMRGVNNREDAAILSMCMYAAALRRAYSHPKSVVIVDEAGIALGFPFLAQRVGDLCANGAKSGIRVILCSQEPGSIKNCAAGDRILANCDLKLVGRIQPEVRQAFQDILHIPKEILAPCMTDAFSPNLAMGYTSWLIIDGRSYTRVRSYASAGGLAAVANNPHEVARRQELMVAAPSPLLGLHRYASELIHN